jgi:hypothetical protein
VSKCIPAQVRDSNSPSQGTQVILSQRIGVKWTPRINIGEEPRLLDLEALILPSQEQGGDFGVEEYLGLRILCLSVGHVSSRDGPAHCKTTAGKVYTKATPRHNYFSCRQVVVCFQLTGETRAFSGARHPNTTKAESLVERDRCDSRSRAERCQCNAELNLAASRRSLNVLKNIAGVKCASQSVLSDKLKTTCDAECVTPRHKFHHSRIIYLFGTPKELKMSSDLLIFYGFPLGRLV